MPIASLKPRTTKFGNYLLEKSGRLRKDFNKKEGLSSFRTIQRYLENLQNLMRDFTTMKLDNKEKLNSNPTSRSSTKSASVII